MTALRIRYVSDLRWLAFFALILLAWALLFKMSLTGAASPHLAQHGAHDAGFGSLFGMWSLMAAAMMAPSLFPALRTYDDLTSAGAGPASGFLFFLGGYLAVWLGYALAGTLAQGWLGELALVRDGRSTSLWLNAALLGGAGAYQFSPLKEACLLKCRAPLGFFMAHWRDGIVGATLMGLRLGVICALCCWALMLLGFVGGTMSLLWMGAATVFMTLEKLPQLGRALTPVVGYALVVGALLTALRAAIFA